MSRVLRKEVVAYDCDLKTCRTSAALEPVAAPSTWHDEIDQILALIGQGWGFVLSPRMRSYCPAHADRVWACSCRTHPTRSHLCTAHDTAAAGMVWDSLTTPTEVSEFLALTKGVHA